MTSEAQTARPPGIPARQVAAVVVGNALEFYDFLTYAFFAVYIGRAFFPSNDPASSLLTSLAVFGAGFVTRPIGGSAMLATLTLIRSGNASSCSMRGPTSASRSSSIAIDEEDDMRIADIDRHRLDIFVPRQR